MTILAVDGHHALHRCLHVKELQDLSSRGTPTGGIFGVLQSIRNALDRFHATRCFVAWDSKPLWRTNIYEGYKSNRVSKTIDEATRDENRKKFRVQEVALTQVLPSLGCHSLGSSGMEGDDILYGIAKSFPDDKVVIMSEDMDLAQLVSDRVSLFRPRKDTVIDDKNFAESVGVQSYNYLLYKAIVGDTSDNVPGIRGMGAKRTKALLKVCPAFGARPELQTDFLRFCAHDKSAPVQRVAEDYVTVLRNLRVMDLSEYPWDDSRWKWITDCLAVNYRFDEPSARQCFQHLEFHSLLETFSSWSGPFRILR